MISNPPPPINNNNTDHCSSVVILKLSNVVKVMSKYLKQVDISTDKGFLRGVPPFKEIGSL